MQLWERRKGHLYTQAHYLVLANVAASGISRGDVRTTAETEVRLGVSWNVDVTRQSDIVISEVSEKRRLHAAIGCDARLGDVVIRYASMKSSVSISYALDYLFGHPSTVAQNTLWRKSGARVATLDVHRYDFCAMGDGRLVGIEWVTRMICLNQWTAVLQFWTNRVKEQT
jgi:hypothetical protein